MNVETLFQTKTVAEVREVQAQTVHAIEQKKKQLRQEVGNSYRDLISSADTITNIADQSGRLVSLIDGLGNSLTSLAAAVEHRQQSSQDGESATSLDKLFALGSRVKYLIDTPETIWGCLDSQDFLTAAQRFVRAGEVHRLFVARSKQVSQRFPLLQHQWPLVKKLGGTVWERSSEWLEGQGGATATQTAQTLAALALLKPIDGAEALKMFLTARQRYIISCLSTPSTTNTASDMDAGSASVILADVACMICATIAQAGELFLQFPGVTSRPLLLRTAATEDLSASELIFDSTTTEADGGNETSAVSNKKEGVCTRIASLSSAGVSMECSRWLEVVAKEAKPVLAPLLASCTSAGDLMSLESAIKTALEEWSYNLAVVSSDDTGGKTSNDEAMKLAWNDICQWVLGQPAALWPLLLEQPVLDRSKGLVSLKFQAVQDSVKDLVAAAFVEVNALPASAPGTSSSGSYSTSNAAAGVRCDDVISLRPFTPPIEASGSATGGANKRRRYNAISRRASVVAPGAATNTATAIASGSLETEAVGWLTRAELTINETNNRLERALETAVDICQPHKRKSTNSTAARRSTSSSQYEAAVAPLDPGVAARAAAVEPFVQEECIAAIQGIVGALASALASSKNDASSGDERFAPSAHAALIIGRVSIALAEGSVPLKVLLGSPVDWALAVGNNSGRSVINRTTSNALGRTSSQFSNTFTSSSGSNPRLEAVQKSLRRVGVEAYDVWAHWASAGLSHRLLSEYAGDAALRSDSAQRGWDEVIVPAPDGSEDMKFLLPGTPSPAALSLALGACAEADRAGGYDVQDAALSLLRFRLAGATAAALKKAASSVGSEDAVSVMPSEKGSLQLIFDARFLLGSLLVGAIPPPQSGEARDAASAAAALTASRREMSAVEGVLSSPLDPIDWATYESHLQTLVDRFAARSRVLLGLIRRGSPTQQDAAATNAAAGQAPVESNVLKLAPAGARFAYLPVNTPSSLRQGGNAMRDIRLRGSITTTVTSLTAADPASHYSFATLATDSGSRARKAAAAGYGTPGGDNYASAAPGSAFDVLRQSRIGSLLGDKAAEAAASVSEFSLGGISGGSLLSSLTFAGKGRK